ncbi:MAG: class I SAM-dependent methyltransferase [Legionella sp.]|nr:class I SAM-dependent methyltransferase [Legionella sp.]
MINEKNKLVKSIIDKSSSAVLIKTIKMKTIHQEYKSQLNISLEKFLSRNNISDNEISLYKCLSTGVEFYTPRTMAGDKEFYEEIKPSGSSYRKERWEWNYVLDILKENDKVLEVGSGNLSFMQLAKNKNIDITGLEINSNMNTLAEKLNLNLINKTIEEYSLIHEDIKYDAIVSFHVIEHVSDIDSFINSCLKILNPGGLFIVALPNNQSFISIDPVAIMNMPPYHLTLWTPASLIETAKLYNLTIVDIVTHKMQVDYIGWFNQCLYNFLRDKIGILGRIISKIIRPVVTFFIKKGFIKLTSPEMIGVFKKK